MASDQETKTEEGPLGMKLITVMVKEMTDQEVAAEVAEDSVDVEDLEEEEADSEVVEDSEEHHVVGSEEAEVEDSEEDLEAGAVVKAAPN